jgi:hypothetical protein
VQVAQYLENGALIASGLTAGETIVTAGVHKLNAGEVIRPLPEAANAAGPAGSATPVLAQNGPPPAPVAPLRPAAQGK